MEKPKKEQITFTIRPDILSRIDRARIKQIWTRGRFLEEASQLLLKRLEVNG